MAPKGTKRKCSYKSNFESKQKDVELWGTRKYKSCYRLFQRRNHSALVTSRKSFINRSFANFSRHFRCTRSNPTHLNSFRHTVQSLNYWVFYNSWRFCSQCKLFHTATLLPTTFRQKGSRPFPSKSCACSKGKYFVPQLKDIPSVLSDLADYEADLLRLFDINVGPVQFAQHRHRVKNWGI